jgi:hypothetical protein
MRPEVNELAELGPMPCSETAVAKNLDDVLRRYEQLILSITKPITDEEARALISIFGEDDAFGLAWSVLNLIESAPGWPLIDVLVDRENRWVTLLRQRAFNALIHAE